MATEAMDFLVEAVEQIPPENWYQPSNLEGWSIRDLVAHVTGSAAKIVALVEGADGQALRAGCREYEDRPHGFASWPTVAGRPG